LISQSPFNDLREKFLNEALIVGLELLRVDRVIAFGIEIVWVEYAHGGKSFLILCASKVAIGALTVPRVEAVVADHPECFLRQARLFLENVVEVLRVKLDYLYGPFVDWCGTYFIMSPGKHDVFKTTVRFIHTVLR
jgi:hypothetical protein